MPEAVTSLVTNQIFVSALISRWTKDERKKIEKEKAQTPKANFPPKTPFPKNHVNP